MPVIVQDALPAIELLRKENIFVMGSTRAHFQDIRPLRIALLNLMPMKILTETDLVRVLSNSPIQVELDLIRITDRVSKNTSIEHLERFYLDFESVRNRNYDGLIVTGAPVEQFAFEEVTYWPEMVRILDWARTHVTSSIFICWSAQAALYHYYGIPKYLLAKKKFGIFEHDVKDPFNPLFRGSDDSFFAPHSRYTEVRREDIDLVKELTLLSESKEAGVYALQARNGREVFVTGHSEYAPDALDKEFKRDVAKGLPIDLPYNYYRINAPGQYPLVSWSAHANLLFTNWLNYYVYQETPFDIEKIA